MNQLVLPFAAFGGVVLAGISVSFLVLVRARDLLRDAGQRGNAGLEQWETTLQAMRQDLDALGAQLGDIEQHPPVTAAPASFRPGLNLSTRSQALRMFRKGEPPERIAMALEVPRQEVDLLLKVHSIVTSNL
jgi:type II secretory pathway component PulM